MTHQDDSVHITGYIGSKDYERLADLAKTQSVVCIVDYEPGIRDVARTTYRTRRDEEHWNVTARGFGYITAFNRAEFIAFCARSNLEFIEPNRVNARTEPSA